jgi:hypothetical protein
MRWAAALQAGLAVFVLALCVALPRPGAQVLLVPLWPGARAPAAIIGPGGDLRLLGPGRPAGSLLVLGGHGLPLWLLLRHGLVPLGVPAVLCGAPR